MAAIAIKYELQALEEFIKHQCNPVAISEPFPAGKIKRWEQFADAELKRIKGNMTVQVLSIAKPRHIELYIQHHEVGIIHLSETLMRFERETVVKLSKLWQQFYSGLQQQLLDLLDFLKHYFESYFDWHQVIPDYRRNGIVAGNFRKYLDLLESYSDDSLELVLQMIRDYWEPIASGIDSQVTFHREHYFDLLFRALAMRLQQKCGITHIIELLLQLNYNDTRFMDYCRMELVGGLTEIDDVAGKLQFLAERIKQLKQMPLPKGNAFNPANPGIVAYCRHWMEEEYRFLQESHRRSLGNRQPEPADSITFKLQTKLSVAQLGIMLQLMHRSGTMKLKNKTDFINFFARNLITQEKDQISEKNLRNSYYNIDYKAKEVVKDTLYEMLKMLREFE